MRSNFGLIDFLLQEELKYRIQERLTTLCGEVSNLASAPSDRTHQTQVAAALSALEAATKSLAESVLPAKTKRIAELGGNNYFSAEILKRVRQSFAQNALMPAVVQQHLHALAAERQTYLDVLQAAKNSLEELGIKVRPLTAGEAELGVVLPTTLFENELGQFQEELTILNGTVRLFYEISNQIPGSTEIRSISASDPTIFLVLNVTTILLIGVTVKWCIDIVRGTLDIKRIADAAQQAGVDAPVVKGIQDQISAKIERAVAEKVNSMLADFRGSEARRSELKPFLTSALEQMLQRIERGMTIELRFIPPSASEATEETKEGFDRLAEVSKSLVFPQVQGQPLLQLTRKTI